MGESLDHLVYRAVPAQNQHQIGSLAYGLPDERACLTGSGGGHRTRSDVAFGERRNGTLEKAIGIAPQRASGGVIDQDRLAKQSVHYT